MCTVSADIYSISIRNVTLVMITHSNKKLAGTTMWNEFIWFMMRPANSLDEHIQVLNAFS